MCGILLQCRISQDHADDGYVQKPSFIHDLVEFNARRGPDKAGEHHLTVKIPNSDKIAQMDLFGWVLHLRGDEIDRQPCVDKNGNVLGFNGEVYGGLEILPGQSDTKSLLHSLEKCSCEDEILACISELEAEYALVYYRADTKTLYFGRDCLGRRSLLWHQPDELLEQFVLSSVQAQIGNSSDVMSFSEVPTTGLFRLKLDQLNSCIEPELIKWNNSFTSPSESTLSTFSRRLSTIYSSEEDLVPCQDPSILPLPSTNTASAIQEFKMKLSEAVRRRVITIPAPEKEGNARLGVLFSGGIDCMVLAAMAHSHLPKGEPIDLLNVGFENPRVLNVGASQPCDDISSKPNKKKSKKKKSLSGESIDLEPEETPVTKETPSIGNSESDEEQKKYNVPDRKTGRLGWKELQLLYPEREWRFVQVNVPYAEAQELRDHIRKLIFPSSTVMDLSIAIAFWFASRGRGVLANNEVYVSTARVLFSGLGADEQLGGYGRHRVAYNKDSWEGLINELQIDVDRISSRNLGRDDRIISDHGKEVRFPYLDENVVQYLCSLPVHVKIDPRFEKGIGEKLLLRQVAASMGLSRASKELKRAVQFGARTAKMEISSGRQKGDEVLS